MEYYLSTKMVSILFESLALVLQIHLLFIFLGHHSHCGTHETVIQLRCRQRGCLGGAEISGETGNDLLIVDAGCVIIGGSPSLGVVEREEV